MEEIWDLYTKNRQKTEYTVQRGNIIPEGYYHAVVDVFVVSNSNKVLLVRRALDKDVYPGLWETGAGGSVLSGETMTHAALRELREETGINAKKAHVFATDSSKISIYTEFLVRVKDDQEITLSDESIEYKWVSFDRFLNILKYDPYFMPSKRNRLLKNLNKLKQFMNKSYM